MTARADRAAGVALGAACGDALGAPYEFAPPIGPDVPVVMAGGGAMRWAPGEWTDDTAMAVPLLEAAVAARSRGVALADRLDDVAHAWVAWAHTAKAVGVQTRAVLTAAANRMVTAAKLADVAHQHHLRSGRSGGNGSLMRTWPVALAYLDAPDALARAARTVSQMTHVDPDAGDACVLWCAAIVHAIDAGELDVRVGLPRLPSGRRDLWAGRIAEAEQASPVAFDKNGWVVHAFQGAWSALATTPGEGAEHARGALEAAVRAGWDTDTVAAIAGALVGARWGASALPAEWVAPLHGWPGLTGADLAAKARSLV